MLVTLLYFIMSLFKKMFHHGPFYFQIRGEVQPGISVTVTQETNESSRCEEKKANYE